MKIVFPQRRITSKRHRFGGSLVRKKKQNGFKLQHGQHFEPQRKTIAVLVRKYLERNVLPKGSGNVDF